MDGSDNFETRFLMNDLCVESEKTYVFGAVNQFHGQVSVFDAKKGACFRCVYPAMPSEEVIQENRNAGVIGAVAGIIGSIEAVECIKILTGIGQPLYSRMLLLDGENMEFREIQIQKRVNCPLCAKYEGKHGRKKHPSSNSASR